MAKNVVITGVSSGIGRASLDILHAKGYHIFGSVRNQADADKLSKIYSDRFTPLRFDVQNHDEVVKASKVVFEQCETLSGLINNAGIAIPGPLEHLSENQFEKQLDVNVKSIRRITNLFFPYLEPSSIRATHLGASSISVLLQVCLILPLTAHTVFQNMLWRV